ncbi:hypothetical protein MHYP_G00284630 [Metynnis hypsauchen]
MSLTPQFQRMMDEDSKEHSRFDMDGGRRKSQRDYVHGKWGLVLLVSAALVIFILFVMIFVIFVNQERRFAELESSMMSHNSLLNTMNSDLNSKPKDSESQNRTLTEVVKLSSSVEALSSKQQSTDQRVMAVLSEIKTELEGSSVQAISQHGMMFAMIRLSASVQSLSSNLESADQRMMDALIEMKAMLETMYILAGGSTCEPEWIRFRSKCYLFSDDKLNWHEARDYCRSQNASLFKLETKDEWAFIRPRAAPDQYWVGLTDEDTGQWRWADGTPYVMNKDDWEEGQPDDWKEHGLGEEGEDCGHIVASGKFNDNHCSTKMKYICKA